MSYILDALQKAERERALGRVPDLATAQMPTTVRRHPWPWLLGGVLAVANLALVGVLLWPDNTPAPELAAPTTPEAADPADSQGAPTAGTGQPSVLVQEDEAAPARPVAGQTPAPLLTVPWDTDPLSQVATLPTPLAPAAPAPRSEPRPEPRPEPRQLTPAVVALNRLPADFRAQLPELRIDALAYFEGDPRRNFALINLSRYGEGDPLREGPVLEAIERDGVVLSFRGRRFRMPLNP